MSCPTYSYSPDDHKKTVDEIKNHLGFGNPVEKPIPEDTLDKELLRKLDESDPHEQAKMFRMVQQNPPKPDFMKVQCFEGCDVNGNPKVFSKSIQVNGETKWIEHEPFYEFSPYDGIKADFAKAPFHVIPRALDEKENVEFIDKKAHTPEKRKDKKDMMFVYILLFSIVGSIAAAIYLMFFR